MQSRLPFGPPVHARPVGEVREILTIGRRPLTIVYCRHRRARRYLLRVIDDGCVRVTVPRGGSREEASRFVREKAGWIERECYRMALLRGRLDSCAGGQVLLGGEETQVEIVATDDGHIVRVGPSSVGLRGLAAADVRRAVERLLRGLAAEVLPRRLTELAATHGHRVTAVTVRNQRTRWGSCSPSGAISLNWRLVQMPESVCDYVLLHELTHLRHANHSRRFWSELERICPWHREARAWIRTSARRAWPLHA